MDKILNAFKCIKCDELAKDPLTATDTGWICADCSTDKDSKKAPIVVLKMGLCQLRICSALDTKKTIEWIRTYLPAGTSANWSLEDSEETLCGDPNPNQCEDDPNRKHYLFFC